MDFLWVGIGGIIGALLRYQLSTSISKRSPVSFPWGTIVVNATGSFLLGLLTRSLGIWFPAVHTESMLLLGTGMCGAYTTFSTFSYEFTMLMQEGRQRAAGLYLTSSFLLCFAGAGIGLYGLPK